MSLQARRRGALGRGAGPGASSAADGGQGVPAAILKQARKSGQLNLSNRSLADVPSTVWRVNLDTPEEGRTASLEGAEDRWWEQVDLSKLILASNLLTSLSGDVALLPALTVLDVHDNRLTSVPESLGQLKTLQRLVLSHNALQSLPESLTSLPDLQTLHVAHNQLSQLPAGLGNLSRLEDLDVSSNRLTSLPATLDDLGRLMKLNVAHNALKTLPHQVGLLLSLRVLEATHNEIHTLPDELGLLLHLETLYLRHNRLTHLPPLHACTNLKELHLGNNSLQGLPVESFSSLRALSALDLRDNRLSALPPEVSLLHALERLDVSNNELSTLPNVLGTLDSLKSIVVDGNPMKAIRRDIVMRGTNELKKYLRSRMEPDAEARSGRTAEPREAARGRANEKQPPSFTETTGTSGIVGGVGSEGGIDRHRLTSSRTLEYVDKKVDGLPDEVWDALVTAGVTCVKLSRNLFTDLPPRLVDAHKTLSELYLAHNRLQRLSPHIGRLDRLQMIDLSGNELSDLPAEMGSLQALREIHLSYNRFPALPCALYQLKKLEIILASDCQIVDLDPDGLCGLTQLATLDLRNNNIATVPPRLGNCTQLMWCQLEGNPFRQPRASILAKGTLAILEYLRSRIPA